MELPSNPTLIVLAIAAVLLLGGTAFNPTELLLTLLRSLKLIPQPPAAPSEQVYRGYVARAWMRLREGDLTRARSLLDAAVQDSEARLAEEQAIAPAGPLTILQDWAKSPMFLIAIAVGAFLLFGGGSCKHTDTQSEPAAEAYTPIRYDGGEPYSGPHSVDVERLRLIAVDDTAAGDTASFPENSPRPLLEPVWRVPHAVPAPTWQYVACPATEDTPITDTGWWTEGPVRRVVSAPVRAVVRAQPLRRAARAVARLQPLRRLGAALGRRR